MRTVALVLPEHRVVERRHPASGRNLVAVARRLRPLKDEAVTDPDIYRPYEGPLQLVTCDACGGRGYTSHRRRCEKCGGLGEWITDAEADAALKSAEYGEKS